MKKVFFGIAIIGTGLFIASCSTEVTGSMNEATEAAESKTEKSLTCSELLDQQEDLLGKEVTIEAFSWGNVNTMDGSVNLDLGDEKLEGMQQTHVTVVFDKDNADAVAAIERDDEVKVKATVGEFTYGSLKLTNPKIIK